MLKTYPAYSGLLPQKTRTLNLQIPCSPLIQLITLRLLLPSSLRGSRNYQIDQVIPRENRPTTNLNPYIRWSDSKHKLNLPVTTRGDLYFPCQCQQSIRINTRAANTRTSSLSKSGTVIRGLRCWTKSCTALR